jgi:DNA-binding Xre family transcriptional regulator/AraC-like DNA-binding protein
VSNRERDEKTVAREMTVLYPMQAKGVGTRDCESVLSYVARLADAHRVSLQNLCRYIKKQSSDPFSSTLGKNPLEGLALKVPIGFIEAVIKLMGQTSLRRCSFENVSNLVNVQTSRSRRNQRYCVECIKQAPYPQAWNRLLWTVDAVEACPEHGILLSDSVCHAPHDKWVYLSDRTFLPGVCKNCRKIDFTCNPNSHIPVSLQQIWVAQQVGEFIAAVSDGKAIDAEELRSGITSIVHERWAYVRDAAQSLNVTRDTIFEATTLRSPVSLKLLLSLCSAADVKLIDLLRGGPFERVRKCEPIVYQPRNRCRVSSMDSSQFHRAADRLVGSEPDITLNELANRLDVSPSTLHRKIRNIVQQLHTRRYARAACRRWRRHLQFARRLRNVKHQIEANGMSFNMGTIYDRYKIILRSDENLRLFQFVRDSL